jgi:hypothetical protein
LVFFISFKFLLTLPCRLKEQYDPFRVESISQAVRNVTAGRAREFREAIDSGIFEELCLEDSEDLRVEGEKNGETTRSFPASMKLPSRLQGCIAKRGNVITLSNISPHVSRDELETMLRECSSSFVSLELALPVSEKSNYRLGWATFTDGTELGPIVATIEEKIMHGDKVYSSAQKSFSLQIKIADPSFSHPDRIVKDWSLAKNMMEALDKRNGIETSLNLEGNSEKSQLDLIITYLRQVHFVCYYSGVTAQGPNELATIAGDIFVRSAQGDAPLSGEALETHDLLIADLTERISHAYQQETEDSLLERHVQKIDEGRFKCGHCEKLFKAPDFVLKHIRLRHEDVSKAATLETAMANAFLAHPPLCAVLPMPRRRSHSPPPQEAPNRRERDYGRTRRPPPKDAPHDPRRIRQYVDWDAPAAGDMEISYD